MKKIGIMSRFFCVIQSTPNLRNNVEFLACCVINTKLRITAKRNCCGYEWMRIKWMNLIILDLNF